ncbi:spherulation-specific family 4 protein [Caminibacter mediatlanticus]|uniref:Spherulin 4-like protein n=1 Tax=Caminibacter mediatlanticus TB-2 TaxID=391592 RepID=A0AAI9AG13_9BACT|nr:spherulation-specific family 4 protein [Caminibacter mediatlanticus]EDM22962.1 spherulin 4 precursor-like protein [Caminibacter mediatlanticus TB-2]
MKKLFLFIFFLFLLFGCKTEVVLDNEVKNKNMIIPVYFYDKTLWDKVVYASLDDMYVIINPSNGPGNYIDSNYQEFINKLVTYKKKPIGYVYTTYGSRNIVDVENDIDKWLELYPNIKGFFIDEVSNNDNNLTYYETLFNYIKSKGDYFVVLNPGTQISSNYFNIADLIVVFENRNIYFNSEICKDNPNKSAVIVYGANYDEMKDIINNSECKYFYITDDNLPNPYDTLPSYFDEEINELK